MEHVISAFIWWAGVLAWVAILTIATAVLAGIATWFCHLAAKNLMQFVRITTARYWIARMEREGLTFPQTEYRRMVAERKPKSVRDFGQLESDEEARLRAQKDL